MLTILIIQLLQFLLPSYFALCWGSESYTTTICECRCSMLFVSLLITGWLLSVAQPSQHNLSRISLGS